MASRPPTSCPEHPKLLGGLNLEGSRIRGGERVRCPYNLRCLFFGARSSFWRPSLSLPSLCKQPLRSARTYEGVFHANRSVVRHGVNQTPRVCAWNLLSTRVEPRCARDDQPRRQPPWGRVGVVPLRDRHLRGDKCGVQTPSGAGGIEEWNPKGAIARGRLPVPRTT
jgi:hypothetical protein